MKLKNKSLLKVAAFSIIAAFSFGIVTRSVSHKEVIETQAALSGSWALSDGKLQFNSDSGGPFVMESRQTAIFGNRKGAYTVTYELWGYPDSSAASQQSLLETVDLRFIWGNCEIYDNPTEGVYGVISGYPYEIDGLDSNNFISFDATVELNSAEVSLDYPLWSYNLEQAAFVCYLDSETPLRSNLTAVSFINYGQGDSRNLIRLKYEVTNDGGIQFYEEIDLTGASIVRYPASGTTTIDGAVTGIYADQPLGELNTGSINIAETTITNGFNYIDIYNEIIRYIESDSSILTLVITAATYNSDSSTINVFYVLRDESGQDTEYTDEFILRNASYTYESELQRYYITGTTVDFVDIDETLVITLYTNNLDGADVGNNYNFVVHFDGNGATSGTMSDDSFTSAEYSVDYELPECSFEREDYAFFAWSPSEDGMITIKPYETRNISYSEDGETFYAIWGRTISFNANGGDGYMEPIVVKEGYNEVPSCDFTRAGYSFECWAVGSPTGTEINAGGRVNVTGNYVLYAVWESQEPEPQAEITSLELLENPPSSYSVGDVIDFQNIILVAHYSDGSFKEVTSNDYDAYLSPEGDPHEPLVSGDYMLYFTYEGVTSSGVPVYVNERQPETMTSYAVTYYPNGTDEEPHTDYTDRVPEGDEVEYMLLQNMFSRPNHIFLGWSTDSSSQTPNYEEGEKVYLRSDISYYAVWESQEPEEIRYTITYYPNGDDVGVFEDYTSYVSGDSLQVSYQFLEMPEEFYKEGYTFAGWSTNPYETIAAEYLPNETYSINRDFEVYPVWIDESSGSDVYSYEIIFVANNGTSDIQTNPLTLPESSITYDLPSIEQVGFTREGYSFVGWSYDSDGEVLKEAPVIQSGTTTTFYAIWELVGPRYQYTVTFDGNGATSGSTDSVILSGDDYSQTIIFPVCGYEREGYIFAGWGFTPEATIMIFQPGQERDITSDTTVYAIWTEVFTISFDANGGEGIMENVTVPKGNASVPECRFTKEGSTFAGWAVGSPDGDVYQVGDSVYVSANYVLYATWDSTTPEPTPEYRQYWTYIDQELRYVDEAHPDYLTRVDKAIYSERSLTASVLVSILNEQEEVVETKYISLSNASYSIIEEGYGSVTGYFNLLTNEDKVITLGYLEISVEKIPVTPEEKAEDISEEQIAQINSLLPESQDSRVEEVIGDLNQGTAYQIVEVATDTKSFIDELREEGGEGYTEEDYQRDLQTVQSATEAAVVVGAASKDSNITTQVEQMTKSVPNDHGVDLGGVLKDFYEQQMSYLLGEEVADKKGDQPSRNKTRALAPKVNKVDVTDYLSQEFDQMLDFVDRSVDDIEDTLLQVRKCSKESVKMAVNHSITTITSKSFRDFDKDKADREFVETLEPVMMATMQSQVLAILEEQYENSDHRNKEKDQVLLDEIDAVKDIETFRIMVMEVLKQKYETLEGSKVYEDLQAFTDEIYWPCFEAWALDKDSPFGFTFEELTKATIESSSKRANSYAFATSADKPEIVFISVFAGVSALVVAGAIVVPTILKKKRRGLAE